MRIEHIIFGTGALTPILDPYACSDNHILNQTTPKLHFWYPTKLVGKYLVYFFVKKSPQHFLERRKEPYFWHRSSTAIQMVFDTTQKTDEWLKSLDFFL